MGRIKKFGKRKFTGNFRTGFTRNTSVSEVMANETDTTPRVSNNVSVKSTPPSSSRTKLKCSKNLYDNTSEPVCDNSKRQESGNIIVDISILSDALCKFSVCKDCKKDNTLL